MFWISYDDLLKKYQHFDRTRLFGPEWTVTQQWTSLNVPWSADYHNERFGIEISRTTPVVVVLSQVSDFKHRKYLKDARLIQSSLIRGISEGLRVNMISLCNSDLREMAKKIISFAVVPTT